MNRSVYLFWCAVKMSFYDKAKAEEILCDALKLFSGGLKCATSIYIDERNERRFPYPSCVSQENVDEDDIIDGMDEFDIDIQTYDDMIECNQWLLRVVGKTSESHHLSLASILVQNIILDRRDYFLNYRDCSTMFERLNIALETLSIEKLNFFDEKHEKHITKFIKKSPAVINKFDMPFVYDDVEIVYNMSLVSTINRLADFYDHFHKSIRCRKIQCAFRRYNAKRHKAASVIQTKWRQVISDPSCGPCKNRMMWEFERLV